MKNVFIAIIFVCALVASCVCAKAAADDAKVIKTAVDEEFVIALDAAKAAGYEWRLSGLGSSSMIRLLSSKVSGDKLLWTFKAQKIGKVRITFKQSGPKETESQAPEIVYLIDIQDTVREHY